MKYQKTLLFLILISSIFQSSYAQINNADNIVGTNFLIKSEILNEERKIQVLLPDSYEGTSLTWP